MGVSRPQKAFGFMQKYSKYSKKLNDVLKRYSGS